MEMTSAERELKFEDRHRIDQARHNPARKTHPDPLEPKLECPLGRLRLKGLISEPEYQAGVSWRHAYFSYLWSIGAPNPFPGSSGAEFGTTGNPDSRMDQMTDEEAERAAKVYKSGLSILQAKGKRVLHAVNAVAVFEEPEELGDFEYTSKAAKIGLAALAASF